MSTRVARRRWPDGLGGRRVGARARHGGCARGFYFLTQAGLFQALGEFLLAMGQAHRGGGLLGRALVLSDIDRLAFRAGPLGVVMACRPAAVDRRGAERGRWGHGQLGC